MTVTVVLVLLVVVLVTLLLVLLVRVTLLLVLLVRVRVVRVLVVRVRVVTSDATSPITGHGRRPVRVDWGVRVSEHGSVLSKSSQTCGAGTSHPVVPSHPRKIEFQQLL